MTASTVPATLAHARRSNTAPDRYNRRWDLQPLLDLTGLSARSLAHVTGFTKRTGARWQRSGALNDYAADRVACTLGLHPLLVWADWCSGTLEGELPEPVQRVVRAVADPAAHGNPWSYDDDPWRRSPLRDRIKRREQMARWGPRLRAQRERSGLSQDGLAALAGLNRKTTGRIERCEFYATEETRAAIASVLGVEPTVLFS